MSKLAACSIIVAKNFVHSFIESSSDS